MRHKTNFLFLFHIFFKDHYYDITTIFFVFFSLGFINYLFFNLLNFYPVTRFLVTHYSLLRCCLLTPLRTVSLPP